MSELLQVGDLHARPTGGPPTVERGAPGGDEILRGLDLTVDEGEVHAIVGPNGSGKSTLCSTLLGSPEYETTAGSVVFRGDDVTGWPTDERAKAGMFLASGRRHGLPGVSLVHLLRPAVAARTAADLSVADLRRSAMGWMSRLGIDPTSVDRPLDDAGPGGAHHESELVQMAVLEPELAILDEIDAGLDGDALRALATGIGEVRRERPTMALLLVAHDQRLLAAIEPDHVHVLIDGRIVASGGVELADDLARHGRDVVRVGA